MDKIDRKKWVIHPQIDSLAVAQLDKLDELIDSYNEITRRFKKDMEHDEVMDGITMKKGEELADHLNSHINLVKDGLKKELKRIELLENATKAD